MRKTLLLLLFMISTVSCYAQDDSLKTVKAKNTVFFELLGSGGLYSVNYERTFDDKVTLRGGISPLLRIELGLAGDLGPGLTIPISSSYLISTDKDSHIELGANYTFFLVQKRTGYWIGPIIGFREQDLFKGGGFARVSFTPLVWFDDEKVIFLSGGVSMGKSF